MRRSPHLKQPQSKLKTVCAWCTKVMAPGQMPITHGICRSCTAIHLEVHHDVMGPMPGYPSRA